MDGDRSEDDGGRSYGELRVDGVHVTAHNAGELWPKNSFLKYPGTVTVSIGAPIACEDAKPEALNAQVADWIEAEMARITGTARDPA